MPGNLQQQLSAIEGKVRMLTERYHKVEAQRDEAYSLVSQLNGELSDCRRRIRELTKQVDDLQMAATVELAVGDLETGRKFLSELVWEIDKCINQLND